MEEGIITKELQAFNTTDAAIAKLHQDYMGLVIQGMDDKEGYERVHIARMDVKQRRVSVAKKGKDLREDAVKFQKAVIAEEKRIIGMLQPIEDHLTDEESRIDDEKARIKAEAAAKEAARIQRRVNTLFSLGCRFDGVAYIYDSLVAPQALIKECTDEQFVTFCNAIQAKVDEVAALKAAGEARLAQIKADQDRIAAEQEQERQRLLREAQAIQEERDKIAREKKAAEDAKLREEQEKVRAAEMEKAKAEAAEKARIETEARIKAEAEARAAKEEKARLAAERRAARAPDKVKILAYIDALDAFESPNVKTDEGSAVLLDVQNILENAISEMKKKVEAL